MDKHSVSLVVPGYNRWELTHKLLFSLYNHLPENCEVVLVNDASTEDEYEAGALWWVNTMANKFPIKYVKNKINLGFGGSHNRGAEVASGDIFVFLSNDVLVNGDFVTPTKNIINQRNGEVIVAGNIWYHDTGWNTLMINGKKSIIPYGEGWLIACAKEMWERIGGWNLDYQKFDYEDVEMGAWAIYHDVSMVALNLPFLKHLGEQTVRKYYPDREKYTNINRKVFEEKWTKLFEDKYNKEEK